MEGPNLALWAVLGRVWGALIALSVLQGLGGVPGPAACPRGQGRVAVTELVSSPFSGQGEEKCCVLEQWCRIYKSTLCLHPCGINSGCVSQEGRNMISLASLSDFFVFLGLQTLYFLKHNRYLLLFSPLSTCSRVGVFLCSETCLVVLIAERECSTALRAFIRQAERRSSTKGAGLPYKQQGLVLEL